jgi:Putative capsular polysaccharide synthesis protein
LRRIKRYPDFADGILLAIDRFLHRLTSGSYHLAKLRSHLHYLWSLRKKPLLVYQMGKVGSSTIVSSLRAQESVSSVYSIYHIHWLTADHLREEDRRYIDARNRFRGTPLSKQRFYPTHVWIGQWLSGRIDETKDTMRWKIITLVRDPIAKNLSSFFQNLENMLGYDYRHNLQIKSTEDIICDLTKLLHEHYLGDNTKRIASDPLTWFDLELKSVFSIDVFATEFPTDKGYKIYESPRTKVLLLKLEDINRCAGDAFREFMGIENFMLLRSNIGTRKVYSELYETFLKAIHLPQHYIDRVYQSKYSRHFYSAQEIEAFRAKWK